MDTIYKVERLGTNFDPQYISDTNTLIIPVDSEYLTDDDSIHSIKSEQPQYVNVPNIYYNLHSMLQNAKYWDLSYALTKEYQNNIDFVDVLKSLFNIDYYNGEVTEFNTKITNLAALLDISIPSQYLDYANADRTSVLADGVTLDDFTRKNDILRNIVKRAYLMHHWEGTYRGYKLPVKFLHRIGALNIGNTYGNINLDQYEGRKYKFLDQISFFKEVLKNGTLYPNTGNIEGYSRFSELPAKYLKYDSGLIYDNDVHYDSTIVFSTSNKQLFVEVALDRLLYNSDNSVYLLNNVIPDSINQLLPYVEKAGDNTNVGSQLTLVTSVQGTFNRYSGSSEEYTHPNIHAKFQVFPDTYNIDNSLAYIKLGTGGGTQADSEVFIDINDLPSSKTTPLDLYQPKVQIPLVEDEIIKDGDYVIVSSVAHSRVVEKKDYKQNMVINGNPKDNQGDNIATLKDMKTTNIDLESTYVTEGSFSMNLYIDTNSPIPNIVPSSLLKCSELQQLSPSSFSFEVLSCSGTSNFLINYAIEGNSYSDSTGNVTSVSEALSGISQLSLPDFIITVSENTVTLYCIYQEYHQRIHISEKYDHIKHKYLPEYQIQYLVANPPVFGGTSGISMSSPETTGNNYTYVSTMVLPDRLVSGTFLTIDTASFPVFPTDTIDTIAARILSNNFDNWSIHWRQNKYKYDFYFTFKHPYGTSNKGYVFGGYSSDTGYETFSDTIYTPVLSKEAILLQPLYEKDMYSSLVTGVLLDYRNDDDTVVTVKDSSLHGKSGTATAVTSAPNPDTTGYGYDFTTSSYITTATTIPSYISIDELSFSCMYNTSENIQDHATLIGNQESGSSSEGWSIQLHTTGATLDLFIYMYSGTELGEWKVLDIPNDLLYHTLTVGWNTSGVSPYFTCAIDGELYEVIEVQGFDIFPTIHNDLPFRIGKGGDSDLSPCYQGFLSDIKVWNRLLSKKEMTNVHKANLGKLVLLQDNQNIYINYEEGTVALKIQYNENGVLSQTANNKKDFTECPEINTDISFSLLKEPIINKFTELGLFDANDSMVAYATFPPIAFDLTKYTLGINMVLVP